MPLHRKQFLLRHQQFWFFSGGQFVLHPGVWWKTSQCRNCFWMWEDSDRLLSERSFGSGWRSGSGNGRDFRAKHTEQRTGAPGFFPHLHQFSGTGRIAFGDKGPITQQTTPTVSNSSEENLVQIRELEVGNKSIFAGLNASFDTLVYYTYLPSAVYTGFVNTYSSLVTFPKLNISTDLELCYATTNQSIEIPNLSFIFPNGETFKSITTLTFEYENQTAFCLGIQNSTLPEIIIGLISMCRYSFTFNQEDKLVGWIPSTCYNDITTSAPALAPIFAPVSTPTSSTPPAPTPPSSAPTSPTPPAPTPPSSAPTSPSPPSLSPKLSPSTGPPTAPPPSTSVMEFVLPSPIITLSLLGFLLHLSLL